MKKRVIAVAAAMLVAITMTACASNSATTSQSSAKSKSEIESALDISKNAEITWSYDAKSDSWTMSTTCAVASPELPDYQGVSVNVPGVYVKGIDTDSDGNENVTANSYSQAVSGRIIIDDDAKITNTNGQTYTAATAPVVVNTGAAGYSAQKNQVAASSNAAFGYINVACGNRGKQSTATDANGKEYYTGDAPLCLVDQKNAIRFVKFNIALRNLPGNNEHFVTTGGSGGGAHATLVAATSDNSDYFPYEVEAGAAGIYQNEDGSYSETIESCGKEITDGVWGCVAYSAITSLQEADMAMAFEYHLDANHEYNTDFQKKMAEYLSKEYMDYINNQNLNVSESALGIDINEDGDEDDTVNLSIEYDAEKYADTNGYGGTYLTLYLKEFESNLKWYLENLDYAEGWTWFDSNGNALSDDDVAKMTTQDKAQAFLEGRYAKSQSSQNEGPGGQAPSESKKQGDNPPDDKESEKNQQDNNPPNNNAPDNKAPSDMGNEVGTPDAGTTQSADSTTDSANYSSFDDMLSAYESDIASIDRGDKYNNNIVDLYDPIKYIGNENTKKPTWTRIVMGAAEGDMSLFASMNLQIAWLNSGTNAKLEWQWDAGHVPSEIFGETLSLYIDQMYGQYTNDATQITKPQAQTQTTNGTATQATGTNISSWATYANGEATFSLKDAASYRSKGAAKAIPGFDVIDYGQETYEFGSSTQDARHFDKYVLKVMQNEKETLKSLFNANKSG